MKLKELMSREVQVLEPEAALDQAAALMSDVDVGMIPIVQDDKVVGVLTDRDIAVRAVAETSSPAEIRVGDVMTKAVIHAYEDDDVEEAARVMQENRVRRLIVLTREGRLAGVLSVGDIACRAGHEQLSGQILRAIAGSSASQQEFIPSEEVTNRIGGVDAGKREASAKQVDSLVRDELSAIETYDDALTKVEDGERALELRRIEGEHREAAALLKDYMLQKGMEAPRSSGLWGAWAKAVEKTAKVFGNKAAIKALKEGEEHGIHDYEDALLDDDLDAQIKQLIGSKLLPQTRAHVPVLDAFLQDVGRAGR
ncbi:MAG TPA: CBS domain-containing protein [Elusimicrobiota bacterium]|nr:CBS domain-containing protein [Elusimicrobiota bacterium]